MGVTRKPGLERLLAVRIATALSLGCWHQHGRSPHGDVKRKQEPVISSAVTKPRASSTATPLTVKATGRTGTRSLRFPSKLNTWGDLQSFTCRLSLCRARTAGPALADDWSPLRAQLRTALHPLTCDLIDVGLFPRQLLSCNVSYRSEDCHGPQESSWEEKNNRWQSPFSPLSTRTLRVSGQSVQNQLPSRRTTLS